MRIKFDNENIDDAIADWNGVIEIPNQYWNQVVTNAEHPEQPFFNHLFIDVSDVVVNNNRIEEVRDVVITQMNQNITPSQGFNAMQLVRVVVSPDLIQQDVNVQDKSIEITENGVTIITPDVGYQGLGEVEITTNVPSDINNQNKELTVTSNGSQTITADQGYSGIGSLLLNVNVPTANILPEVTYQYAPQLESRESVIEPTQDYDGIRRVNVQLAGVSAHLVNGLVDVITSNGTYILPELNPATQMFGYAQGARLSIEVPTLSKKIITKLRCFYQNGTTSQTNYQRLDINNLSFEVVNSASLTIYQGHSYIIVKVLNNHWYYGYINCKVSLNMNIESDNDLFYYYDIGSAKYIELVSFRESNGTEVVNIYTFFKLNFIYQPINYIYINYQIIN